MDYIEIGKIRNTHGLRGEIKCESYGDDAYVLADMSTLCLEEDGEYREYAVVSSRVVKGLAYLKFDGVDDIDSAGLLKGKTLYCRKSDIPVEEGRHLIADLIGLEVVDASTNESYGRVKNYIDAGGHGLYEVEKASGNSFFIPDVPEFISDIEDEKRILVTPIEGLIE